MAGKRTRASFEADQQAQQSPYVFYGTPLPPLDDSIRDDGSFVPVWQQEVTDDRGRKRLHGAFTGGFSAGYFNTVGSKEGWTPSTFVSSRQHRAKDDKQRPQQRPEDFMDEEDIREVEEAKQLRTTDSFAGLGSTEEDAGRWGGLTDIFRTPGETIGTKLLKKMGWREGQGIGPKVRRRANLEDEEDPSHMGEADIHLFAPANPPMISFVRKADRKGLGYEGEARLDVESSKGANQTRDVHDTDEDDQNGGFSLAPSQPKKSKKPQVKKGGFGIGVLNDTGSDDEDPYEMGPRISYNRVIGGDKKPPKKAVESGSSSIGSSNPLLKSKPIFISKKSAAGKSTSGFRRCHDGRLPLDGFILAQHLDALSITSQDGKYQPPRIPKDWKSSKQPSQASDTSKYTSTADAAKASTLDPKSRAALLGEAQLPGKSVFDFLTPTARDKLVAASGQTNLPAALGEAPPKGFETTEDEKQKSLQSPVPNLDSKVALQALSRGVGGWMPYADDESKRARYRAFLEIRAGIRKGIPERPSDMPKDEWVTEMHEFARAAQVFKPITGMMASRFTSSTSQSSGFPQSSGQDIKTDSPLSKPARKPEDPAEEAAKMGMFGPMTRSVGQFYPTRLLCKRFNVKPPAYVQLDPGDTPAEGATSEGRFQSAGFQGGPSSASELVPSAVINQLMLESGGGTGMLGEAREGSLAPVEQPEKVMIDAERNEALESERPGEAVFKAIFGDSDDDEEEDP